MNHQDTTSPTLFNLLARHWDIGSPVKSALYNTEQSAAGFLLKDGTIAIAKVADNDAPGLRIHVSAENGRTTISPRTKAPEPLTLVGASHQEQKLFGAFAESDFVTGNTAGDLCRTTPDGQTSSLNLDAGAGISAFDYCHSTSQLACASNSRLLIFDTGATEPTHRIEHGEPIACATFSPDGKSICVAHDYGLTIWSILDGQHKTMDINFPGRSTALHWSHDGKWIASPLTSGGFQLSCADDGRTNALVDYPEPVTSISWNQTANALVTSGAFRITAWSMDNPPITDKSSGVLETGRAGLVPVSAVASHSKRNLIVAGYANGLVSIAQLGGRDELVVNSENHGAITCLDWSRDGKSVLMSTDRQLASIISVPPQLLK